MTSRGEKIIFYQNLYKQYSRLAFTRWEDRPIAIAGLERRLISDLNTHGGFGVFDDEQSLLRRSLLWQRGKDDKDIPTTLRKIIFPANRNLTPPTWSWMAYEGGIDFLELPFGGVDWQKDDIRSPWTLDSSNVCHTIDQTTTGIELCANAREFNTTKAKPEEFTIVYDIPSNEVQSLMCIVMGRRIENGVEPEDARHYVLFITSKEGAANVYERVGVGHMPGKFIDIQPSRLVKVH